LILRAAGIGAADFWRIATTERTLAALRLSFGASLLAALIDAALGLLLAWVLVRYRFPGRGLVNGLVDLPVALPTAVAGISLTAIYAPNGIIGSLFEPLGIKIAYTPVGIVLALIFIGLPFVVRTLQPVIAEFEKETEEAAVLLGASRARTVFAVVLPAAIPALLTGFALAFARALGEYGSVIFIAGNMPGISEIAPLLIVVRLEEFDYAGATVIATVILAIAFAFLLAINLIAARARTRLGYA
jgi:sulfate transport system permease protein